MKLRAQHRLEDVPRVLQPVHVADFVAVKSRDRDFEDAHPGKVQLHDDIRVEMEVVRVALEWNPRERLHGVKPVAAVEFAELRAEQRILKLRQHLIPDPFVKRHPTFERIGFVDHPRPENSVGFIRQKWTHQFGQLLRGVLSVSVNQRDNVESVVDRVAVAEFLIAAVSLVLRIAEHHHFERSTLNLAFQAGLKSGVLAEVVDDEHFDVRPVKFGRDAVQNALDGFLSVVGDDKNEQALFSEVDGHCREVSGLRA